MVEIYADVSEHQNVVINSRYNRKFFMYRSVNENGYLDKLVIGNRNGSLALRAIGKLVNFGTYIIPCLISNSEILEMMDVAQVPRDCVVMIDMESWDGRVQGNHTIQLNLLSDQIRARQGGRADLVWGYGNLWDLATIWPGVPDWLGVIEANYGPATLNAPPGIIGWQFSNGVVNGTQWPNVTPPFPSCDHNVLFIDIPLPEGEKMALSNDDKTWIKKAIADAMTRDTAAEKAAQNYLGVRLAQAMLAGHPNELFDADDVDAMFDVGNLNPRGLSSALAKLPAAVVKALPAVVTGAFPHNDVKVAVKEAIAEGTDTK